MQKQTAYKVTIPSTRLPGQATCCREMTAVFLQQPGTGHIIEAFPDLHSSQRQAICYGEGFILTPIEVFTIPDEPDEVVPPPARWKSRKACSRRCGNYVPRDAVDSDLCASCTEKQRDGEGR